MQTKTFWYTTVDTQFVAKNDNILFYGSVTQIKASELNIFYGFVCTYGVDHKLEALKKCSQIKYKWKHFHIGTFKFTYGIAFYYGNFEIIHSECVYRLIEWLF